MKKIYSASAICLMVCVTTLLATSSGSVIAQTSMKTKEESGGGLPPGSKPPKPRPICKPQLDTGTVGPIAKAVWQVPSPGKISFCVLAGVQGTYAAPSTGAGANGLSSNSKSLTQRIAVRPKTDVGGALALPIRFELRDARAPDIFEREWDPSQPDEQAPLSLEPALRIPHASLKFPATNMQEPQPPNASAYLPYSWCVDNLKWSKRPFLVVSLSGPGVRGRTDRADVSCSVDFGLVPLQGANLRASIGAPAFPTTEANPTGPKSSLPKQPAP